MNYKLEFFKFFDALSNRNKMILEEILHPRATFEFPYALPSMPNVIKGRSEIIYFLLNQKFSFRILKVIHIESTTSGQVIAEIISEESFHQTGKALKQYIACNMKVSNGQIEFYKEFFNPITRLEGLLDLDRENFIFL